MEENNQFHNTVWNTLTHTHEGGGGEERQKDSTETAAGNVAQWQSAYLACKALGGIP